MKEDENKRFIRLVDSLLSVPHSAIKEKLNEEKRKRKKSKKPSASGHDSNDQT